MPASGPAPVTHRPEDYARRAEQVRSRLPSDDFTLIIEEPFIVVGDEAPEDVHRRAVHTVKWAVDRLKDEYFTRDPADIISIWLFKDKASYERNTHALFGESPHTPFGYYSPAHRALIMNIATGGGTLVHEIVHPFVASNFPGCPPWFNEGLGSLYEQCAERDGRIRGLTNWRLAGLQQAIRSGETLEFPALMRLKGDEFYGDNRGIHYAQARYLCYYLQEKGLLRTYYHQFRDSARNDPSGVQTLKEVLKVDDLEAFRVRWEKFVLELSFP
jgi:hypothetical protein